MRLNFIFLQLFILSCLVLLASLCNINKPRKVRPYLVNRGCISHPDIDNHILLYPNKKVTLSDILCIEDSYIGLYLDSSIIEDIDPYIVLTEILNIVNDHIRKRDIYILHDKKTEKRLFLFLDAIDIYFANDPYILNSPSRVKCTYIVNNNWRRLDVALSTSIDIHISAIDCNLFGKVCKMEVDIILYKLVWLNEGE